MTASLEVDVAGSWTRGEDRDSNEPLNTVDPPSLVTRVHWHPNDRWRGGFAVRGVAAQHQVDHSNMDLFEPDGYVVFDLTAGYSPTDNVRVNAGVFNLMDETYWRWSSVRGRPEGDPLIDVLAAPGRYGALSVHVRL
jgi:hemoglobin/transferrin/lactoferrin receptor protein